MSTSCTKCGEELLGAVNRCWKCGQAVAPAVPFAVEQAMEAIVVDQQGGVEAAPFQAPIPMPLAPIGPPVFSQARRATTAELIEARRAGMMAMGGAVTSLLLGLFAVSLAYIWPVTTLIAVLGLGMGIWGLHSPKRSLALIGMLLCCLAIGLGTFSAARGFYIAYLQRQPIQMEYEIAPGDVEP